MAPPCRLRLALSGLWGVLALNAALWLRSSRKTRIADLPRRRWSSLRTLRGAV
jgi:hypothetical protein